MNLALYLPTGHDASHAHEVQAVGSHYSPSLEPLTTRGALRHITIEKVPVTMLEHHCTHNMQAKQGAASLPQQAEHPAGLHGWRCCLGRPS